MITQTQQPCPADQINRDDCKKTIALCIPGEKTPSSHLGLTHKDESTANIKDAHETHRIARSKRLNQIEEFYNKLMNLAQRPYKQPPKA